MSHTILSDVFSGMALRHTGLDEIQSNVLNISGTL